MSYFICQHYFVCAMIWFLLNLINHVAILPKFSLTNEILDLKSNLQKTFVFNNSLILISRGLSFFFQILGVLYRRFQRMEDYMNVIPNIEVFKLRFKCRPTTERLVSSSWGYLCWRSTPFEIHRFWRENLKL